MCRAHGWDRNLTPEQQTDLRDKNKVDDFFAAYTFHELAYNARPTEVQGFLGNTQLPYLDETIAIREKNFNKFVSAVPAELAYPIRTNHMSLVSNFAMPIICRNEDIFKKYISKFKAAEVEIRPVIAGNMVKQPFYKKYLPVSKNLPKADLIHDNGFYFGNHPDLTESEMNILTTTISSPF
jgi:CDP-6-deoxy-D-xylo-4-hexulose-3-dehydrase